MRSFRLARIAAQAEFLRLRLLLRRQALRVAFAALAVLFLLAALVGAHVGGFLALAETFTPVHAVLIVIGVDLLIAIIFAVLAARDTPSAAEREALQVRRTAARQASEAVAISAVIGSLGRVRSFRHLSALIAALAAVLSVGRR